MEKTQFLEQYLFENCKNISKKTTKKPTYLFSETDFEIILDRSKDLGIGIYTIETFFKNKPYASTSHEEHKKKATDYRWFQRAFGTFKRKQAGLTYTATYKISPKLLAKSIFKEEEE